MTKLHVHEFTGLKPEALATYLAALGVMRLLATQEKGDPAARGFWRDEHFVIVSELDWGSIERFFLEDYSPTPILAPWNSDSGFFTLKPPDVTADSANELGIAEDLPDDVLVGNNDEQNGDETDRAVGDPLLDRFAESPAPRLAPFRRAIEVARAAISHELRSAEEAAVRAQSEKLRCAQAEMDAGSARERAKCEHARTAYAIAETVARQLKAEFEAKKAAVARVAKSKSEREALEQAKERSKQAQEQLRTLKKEAQELEKTLKIARTRATRDEQAKARLEIVAERASVAKKCFAEILKATKSRLVADVRAKWAAEGREWLDAAITLDDVGDAGFTSLFGSGGNDGRMEFTKNLRDHINALFDIETGTARGDTASALRSAIFGYTGNVLRKKAVGQFFPGRAGGTNMGSGFSGAAGINPWEFVLMLEGAVALVSGITRYGDVTKARVSSPFWVAAASAGFGSASQREASPRGEQWLPLWSHPMRYDELVELVREGRAQIGHQHTRRAADLVRAAARLGLARGIDSLQRFAYLKRNGESNLAVSAGRFRVASRSRQELLDDVGPWIERIVWYASDKDAPTRLGVVARRAADALFGVCRQDAPATLWRQLLVTLGEAEFVLLHAGKNPARQPLPRLRSGWLDAIDDRTPEGQIALRLALALASQHRPIEQRNAALVDSVRQHFFPLDDADGPRPRFKLDPKSGRAERDLEHVCLGRDLVTDLIALVERRSLWARSANDKSELAHRLPLEAVVGCEATLDDVSAWVRGEVSDEAVRCLVRPLLALDWGEVVHRSSGLPVARRGVPDPLQMLFRLAHLPFNVPVYGADGQLQAEVAVLLDPEPLRRLAAGDLDGALRVAIRRLEASGLRPVFRRGVATLALARRLGASLAFPITRNDAARAARLVCKPCDIKDTEEVSATSANPA